MTIIGNWKMYPSLSDALVLASRLKQELEKIRGVEIVLAPPLPWIIPIQEQWHYHKHGVQFAAQSLAAADQGAYTGETSNYFMKDIVGQVIIGHSERRQAGETKEDVAAKLASALKWKLKPTVCIGELRPVLDGGKLEPIGWHHLLTQAKAVLAGLKESDFPKLGLAYEPVWAIGGGKAARPEYVAEVLDRLMIALTDEFGPNVKEITWLYGGSVDSTNAVDYLRLKEVDGLLVGSASVKAKEFIQICHLASSLVSQ